GIRVLPPCDELLVKRDSTGGITERRVYVGTMYQRARIQGPACLYVPDAEGGRSHRPVGCQGTVQVANGGQDLRLDGDRSGCASGRRGAVERELSRQLVRAR